MVSPVAVVPEVSDQGTCGKPRAAGLAAWSVGIIATRFPAVAARCPSAPRGGHVTVKANVYGFWMGTLSLPMALCTSLMLTW
jgi:hypothetical protein